MVLGERRRRSVIVKLLELAIALSVLLLPATALALTRASVVENASALAARNAKTRVRGFELAPAKIASGFELSSARNASGKSARERGEGVRVHHRNRIWDPGLGAFLSPDEFVFHTATGTVWSWPGQNPVLYRDSTGRFWDQVLPRVTPANPTSFIGIVVGVVGGSGLPDVSLTSAGLVLEFHNNAIQSAAGQSTTYGHVIVYSRVGTATIATKRPHELAHVKQHAILGELYLPAHLLAGAYSLLTAGSWAKGNPLEAGPYSTPPCAF